MVKFVIYDWAGACSKLIRDFGHENNEEISGPESLFTQTIKKFADSKVDGFNVGVMIRKNDNGSYILFVDNRNFTQR